MDLESPPLPRIESVVNAASLAGPIAPGMLVSIFGSSLGPRVLASSYDTAGMYPFEWGHTKVTFNGIPAPVLYVSPGRVNAVVLFALSGQTSAQMVVSHYTDAQSSPPFSVPVAETGLAVFTSPQDGSGPGGILVYPGGGLNSADNPAAPGGVITLFFTGAGVREETFPDGSIAITAQGRRPLSFPASLTIGGKAARVVYAGPTLYASAGHLQVNAELPEGLPSGQQPLVLKIGEADNAEQRTSIFIQ